MSQVWATASAAAKFQDKATTVSKGLKASLPKRKGPPPASSRHSSGTKLQSLELLEIGHLKLKPVLQAVVLGHLFMRKYGLSRQQRAQVIRLTGGSCSCEDIEKVIKASEFEDRAGDHASRASGRRDTLMVAAEQSMSEPDMSSEDANE